jgi:hypothetical protein
MALQTSLVYTNYKNLSPVPTRLCLIRSINAAEASLLLILLTGIPHAITIKHTRMHHLQHYPNYRRR